MEPRYSASYIDQLVGDSDTYGLHQLISVVGRRATVPDELWGFARVLEWIGSTRSGVWQYYESIDGEVFQRLEKWLSQVGWQELSARYAQGKLDFSRGDYCEDLDAWLDEHEGDIVDGLWALLMPQVEWLKRTASE